MVNENPFSEIETETDCSDFPGPLLNPTEVDSLLSRILSTLSEDGWYLNCGGRRIPLLKASGDSLRALAERKLLRHGRRRDQDAWDDLLHARSDTSSGSESGSSSSSDSDA